jgi:hypothetical protein
MRFLLRNWGQKNRFLAPYFFKYAKMAKNLIQKTLVKLNLTKKMNFVGSVPNKTTCKSE